MNTVIHDRSTKVLESAALAIIKLQDLIETPEYENLVKMLYEQVKDRDFSKRIVITGVGKNANIATKISETMASLGIPSFYLNASHAPHGDFGFISPNDFIIHISRSGTTDELLSSITYIKEIFPNVRQCLIHCNGVKAASDADYELFIGKVQEGDEHGLAPTTSTTALLCILDAISASVSSLLNFERMDFLKFHPAGALGKMLNQEKNKQ